MIYSTPVAPFDLAGPAASNEPICTNWFIRAAIRRADSHPRPSPTEICVFFHQSVSICMVNTTQCFNTPLDRLVQWSLRSEVQLALLSGCTLGAARVRPGGSPEPPAVASTTFSTCGVAVRWQSVKSIYMKQCASVESG